MAALIGLLLLPLLMWRERSQKFQRLNPVEQNLQRASHGFAVAALTVALIFGMYGKNGIPEYFTWLQRDPSNAWPGLLFLVPIIYGLARFMAGASRTAGVVRDGLLAFRAFVKLAIGFGVTGYLARFYPWPGVTGWYVALLFAVLAVAVWCAITGTIRFLLLIWPRWSGALPLVISNIAAGTLVWRTGRKPWGGIAAFSAIAVAGLYAFWEFWKS